MVHGVVRCVACSHLMGRVVSWHSVWWCGVVCVVWQGVA